MRSIGLTLALLLSAITPNILPPVAANPAPTITSVDISRVISDPLQMAIDHSNLYVVDGNGSLAIIDTASFSTKGLAAISTINVFPFQSPNDCCGNFAGAYALTIRNGYAWIGGGYNVGYGLARVSLTDHTVTLFLQYAYNPFIIEGLVADDNYVYAAFFSPRGGIARFNQTGHTWSTLVPGIASTGLLLDGNTLWFTSYPNSTGRINTDGSGLRFYNKGFSETPGFLANATDGKIWFTDYSLYRYDNPGPTLHKIGVLNPADGSVVEYDFPVQAPYCPPPPYPPPCTFQDGPAGLTFDLNGKLWVAGYASADVREFDPGINAWTSTNLNFSGTPFFLLRQGDTVWGDSRLTGRIGKTFPGQLFQISTPEQTTTTITCDPSTTMLGEPTNCTATVSGNAPTGLITWASSSNGLLRPSACTLTSGQCSISYTPSSPTALILKATYNGDSNHQRSIGTLSLPVTRAASNTQITCNPSQAMVGSSLACIVTVSGQTPNGVVTFSSSSSSGIFTPSNGQCTLSSGQCQITYNDSHQGTSQITATYEGDPNNDGSQGSDTVSVTTAGGEAYGLLPDLLLGGLGALVAVGVVVGIVSLKRKKPLQ